MIYVYRQAASTGARVLAEALGGRRVRNLGGVRLSPTMDKVVCWGETWDLIHQGRVGGGRFLNAGPIRNKLEDARILTRAGVRTVEVSETRPATRVAPVADPAVVIWQQAQEIAEGFTETHLARTRPVIDAVSALRDRLNTLLHAMAAPAPVATPQAEWLARLRNHTGGTDLLTPPTTPQYWSKKETLVSEYRVHSFLGRSIRAGKKVHREGVAQPHAWIRSWDGGWKISYDGIAVQQRHRDIAHQAVTALGLQFGAVDIGERQDGSLIVLEVNRAPGLEGGTIEAYARAIQGWANEAR